VKANAGPWRWRKLTFAAILAAAGICGCALGREALPVVLYTTPANGTATYPLSGKITAVFSKSMDGASITTATFLLSQGTNAIAGTVAFSGNNATFQPSSPLPFSAVLTATIITGAKDLSGNSLPTNYV